MVRDPRAVYVSEVRRRMEVGGGAPYGQLRRVPRLLRGYILHEVAWAWASAVHQHRRLSALAPDRYRPARFEDLVRSPEATIASVVADLGLPWEARLLQQRVYAQGVNGGVQGFDAGSADRWRGAIGPAADGWIRELLGGRLAEMGYAP